MVPDLRMLDTQESPLTGTHQVDLTQMRDAVPIFGTRAVVDSFPWTQFRRHYHARIAFADCADRQLRHRLWQQ